MERLLRSVIPSGLSSRVRQIAGTTMRATPMKPTVKPIPGNDRGNTRTRRGSALLWVMALSVMLGASIMTMFSMARDINTLSQIKRQKVTYYNQEEREAERFRSWLIREYLNPDWSNNTAPKNVVRTMLRNPIYINDTDFMPALGA